MKLKAFTIIELMVGMALTAIISISAFSAYYYIKKHFSLIKKSQNLISSHQKIRHLLQLDFTRADLIETINNKLIISDSTGQIIYDFRDSSLLREHSKKPQIKDTFHLNIRSIQFLYEEEIKADGIINQLDINFISFEKEQNLKVKKEYAAESLINYFSNEY